MGEVFPMTRAIATTALCSALLGCQASTVSTSASASATPQTGAAAPAKTSAPVFDSSKAWEHLRQMVAIGPRPAGSAAIRQTRAYITRQMSAMGLTVQEQPFTAQTPKGPIEMVNLIVRLPGKRADRILFTGHYDTKLFTDATFVGASDGGSSGAFLMELARVLKDQPREFTYEFVWFDGEEAVIDWYHKLPDGSNDNTYGSKYFVQAARKANALAGIKAMILVDMIGNKSLQIKREQKSTMWLKDLIWAAAKRVGHGGVFIDQETTIDDDHTPFLEAGVPSVDIIDFDNYQQFWHTPGDNLAAVSARSLQIVGDVILAAIPSIEKRLASAK